MYRTAVLRALWRFYLHVNRTASYFKDDDDHDQALSIANIQTNQRHRETDHGGVIYVCSCHMFNPLRATVPSLDVLVPGRAVTE